LGLGKARNREIGGESNPRWQNIIFMEEIDQEKSQSLKEWLVIHGRSSYR